MELAVTIGMSITEFWDITPYELSIALKGFYKRKEIEAEQYVIKHKQLQKDLTITAYQISRWVWQKKVDIKKILNDKPVQKEMTDEKVLEQVKLLNQMFGGAM